MENYITSALLGKLKRVDHYEDLWRSKQIIIPFFGNKKSPVEFIDFLPQKDRTFIKKADNALSNFFEITKDKRKIYSGVLYNNCMTALDAFDDIDQAEELRNIKDQHDIWRFLEPTFVAVRRSLNGDRDVYVIAGFNCPWEEELGLQLLFRQGKTLTRVGPEDGYLTDTGANNTPDQDDNLLLTLNDLTTRPQAGKDRPHLVKL